MQIVCCLPATAETEKIVSATLLATCKPGAVFINVGRCFYAKTNR